MSYRSPCLTSRLFLGHPSRIKRPPNVSSAKGECFRVDLKQMMLCGGFLGSEMILLFCFMLLCLFLIPVIYCGSAFVQRYITTALRMLDTMSQTDALHKALKLHMVRLLMCCHSCWCVWTRNEASTHITLTEMNRHTVCVLCVHGD